MRHSILLATTAIIIAGGPLMAQTIENPSFEQGWTGWDETGPGGDGTAISDEANTGAKSAKITSDVGSFEQVVAVHPDSEYSLSAVVKGNGTIGVKIDGDSQTVDFEGQDWGKQELTFETGANTSVVIFGAYVDGDSRFDDFEIAAVGGAATSAAADPVLAPGTGSDADEVALGTFVVPAPQSFAALPDACENMSQLQIASASDDGTSEETHPPAFAVDSNFDPDSRWSSKFPGKMITFDLERPQTLKEVGVAWYSGHERRTSFEIAASMDGTDYEVIIPERGSGGKTNAIERYDFDDIEARYIRLTGLGNEENEWNSVVEFQAYGCGDAEIASTGDGSDIAKVSGMGLFGLKTDVPPSENFDLTDWKLTLPVDRDGDSQVDEIEEVELSSGWTDPDYFYTDPVTGGMVFRSVSGGGATTQRSRHVRSELREMLRAGDTSISTRNDDETPNKNNWVFSSAPQSAQEAAGGIDGILKATLAVNQVSREAPSPRVGRVVIGQIHASDDEPIRLYYRKLPHNKFGSIYYAHVAYGDQDTVYVDVIGDRGNNAENPADGIALDEIFSYEISVEGKDVDGVIHPILNLKIIRDDGTEIDAPPFDMIDSGFNIDNDFMFFKAGAYSQARSNSATPDRDYDQVTFYALENIHD